MKLFDMIGLLKSLFGQVAFEGVGVPNFWEEWMQKQS